ncbi:hypothetical protein KQ246_07260 [Pseudoalteromonas shioyasakiensis]|nr:hypothetical protein KQ246_07260 [Pseudoalteromonas shioyasakiensis]
MSSVTRIAQHRMTQHLRCNNIIFGSAIVVSAKIENVEGWVLPGGKFTRNRTEAFKTCRKMHCLIEVLGGIKPVSHTDRAA